MTCIFIFYFLYDFNIIILHQMILFDITWCKKKDLILWTCQVDLVNSRLPMGFKVFTLFPSQRCLIPSTQVKVASQVVIIFV